ncbi:MAG: outer membrane protein assembly factor BamD [Acidobacteria bacterium]|nr:outer membrane protein assembly factor BamD [Acidobacteriota bacterium]
MYSRYLAAVGLCLILVAGLLPVARAQDAQGTHVQRLEVLRSKLDGMKRSLNSAIANINATEGSDKEKDKNSPEVEALTRLRGLEREVSSIMSDVSSLRTKVEKAERYEVKDIDKLEAAVADVSPRVEAGLLATANVRKSGGGETATAKKKKKKKGRLFGLLGGGGDDKYEELTGTVAPGRDRELFELAAKEVRKDNYETGRLLFNTIITTYPDSQYLPLAKLAIADSFYLEGTTPALIQASAAYQDWLTFFPTDPLADDVMLKVAESEMRQMGLADRDVSRARKAEQRLKVLLQQFPNTPLRPEVEQRLTEVQENLGLHDMRVADFYLDARYKNKKGGLKGAQSRYREIYDKYPNFSYMDKVLFNLGYTYQEEEEPDEAVKYYQQLVRNYPNSEYVEKAKEQLGIIGAAVPEPDAAALKRLPPERAGFMKTMTNEIFGNYPVTVNKNGILISKDSKEGGDLIDIAIARGGQLPDTATPQAPRTTPRNQPSPQPTPAPENKTTP